MSAVVKSNDLNAKNLKIIFKKALFYLLITLIGVIIATDMGRIPNPAVFIPIILFGIPSFFYSVLWNRKKIKIKGQRELLTALEELNDEYTILSNVFIPDNGKLMEVSHIVVASNGIFVVGLIGQKGLVTESKNDRYWISYPKGKYSTRARKVFSNPVLIYRRKSNALLKYLRKRDIRISVKSIVYFNNETNFLSVNKKNNSNVYTSKQEMLNYITNFTSKKFINEADKEKIINELCLNVTDASNICKVQIEKRNNKKAS